MYSQKEKDSNFHKMPSPALATAPSEKKINKLCSNLQCKPIIAKKEPMMKGNLLYLPLFISLLSLPLLLHSASEENWP